MKVFFICCAIFLFFVWICASIEHGEDVGNDILDTIKAFFGYSDNNDSDDFGGDGE